MNYDIGAMQVDREALLRAIDGDLDALISAFIWFDSPQGYEYWESQHYGKRPLDTDALKEIYRQEEEEERVMFKESYAVFSIDFPDNLRVLEFLSDKRRRGYIKRCVGAWAGKVEPAFACDTKMFYTNIYNSEYVRFQQAFLIVNNSAVSMKKSIAYIDAMDGNLQRVGVMTQVPVRVGLQKEGWTYDLDEEKMWTVL